MTSYDSIMAIYYLFVVAWYVTMIALQANKLDQDNLLEMIINFMINTELLISLWFSVYNLAKRLPQ